MSEPIALSRGMVRPREWSDLEQILSGSRWNALALEEHLERAVGAIVERPFAVAFASTGSACRAALRALGARDRSVVCPALVPSSLLWALRSECRLLVGDVDPKSLNLDAGAAEELVSACERRRNDRTDAEDPSSSCRAIVACAAHGHPGGLDALAALASRHELPLLEIVAGGLGGSVGRDPVGRFGRVSVIALGEGESTIGSGGAVCVTNDDVLAARLQLLRGDGAPPAATEWERLGGIRRPESEGLDARIAPLGAALGLLRLGTFAAECDALERVFHGYIRRLATHPELSLPAPCADGTVRWSHFPVRLSERYAESDRDAVVDGLLRHDVAATSALHLASDAGHEFRAPVAEWAASRLIALPFSAELSERDVDLVCQTLQVMIERQSILR